MIVDAHYHLDPRLEPIDRLLAQMREHRIDRVALIATVCDPLRIGGSGRRFAQAMRRALAGAAPRLGAGAERGDFRRLPDRFPRLKVVYAHAGIHWYRALWADAARRDNVFVDLSSPYLDKALRYEALRALGAARCLYGSDGPYGYPTADGGYDHGAILGQIQRSGLAARDLDRVLGVNFVMLTASRRR